jgi:DNA-binding protein HU-beta
MNKAEFVQKVARLSGLPVKDARKAVEAIFNADSAPYGVLAEELAKSQKITLPGFGTFEARRRKAREGRNPRSGETIKIGASTYPSFRPGKNLKALVHDSV